MNTETFALTLGPCADHEFDLVELHERTLDPERAGLVQRHLERCTRCRSYLAALDELDGSLAAALPRPVLSSDFDSRLQARIAELRQGPNRAAALAAAELEHEKMLRKLGRGLGWRTALNSLALASAAGGLLLGLTSFAPGMLGTLGLVPAGLNESVTFSIVLGVAFLAGGALYARRPVEGPLLLAG